MPLHAKTRRLLVSLGSLGLFALAGWVASVGLTAVVLWLFDLW